MNQATRSATSGFSFVGRSGLAVGAAAHVGVWCLIALLRQSFWFFGGLSLVILPLLGATMGWVMVALLALLSTQDVRGPMLSRTATLAAVTASAVVVGANCWTFFSWPSAVYGTPFHWLKAIPTEPFWVTSVVGAAADLALATLAVVAAVALTEAAVRRVSGDGYRPTIGPVPVVVACIVTGLLVHLNLLPKSDGFSGGIGFPMRWYSFWDFGPPSSSTQLWVLWVNVPICGAVSLATPWLLEFLLRSRPTHR